MMQLEAGRSFSATRQHTEVFLRTATFFSESKQPKSSGSDRPVRPSQSGRLQLDFIT